MATLVFADTHLSDRFEPELFAALKPLIERADTVIILGDLWDWYKCSFDAFCSSEWALLFPLLNSKKTYYIFGNHDRHAFCDERVKLFSQWQGESLSVELDGVSLQIEHGDRIAPSKDGSFPRLSRFFRPVYMRYYYIEDATGRRAKWLRRMLLLTRWWAHLRILKYVKLHSSTSVRLMGHSHIPVADLANKYFNPGAFGKGYASYLWIENGDIALHEEAYE